MDRPATRTEARITALAANVQQFRAFVARRIGDPHLAEDVVQESLLKALKAADQVRDDEKLVAWFYRILRRAIVDVYRRNAGSRTEPLDEDSGAAAFTAEEERTLCGCFASLLPTLKQEHADVLRRLDLEQRETRDVAAELGLTENNLRVRLHRARLELRKRLEETCRVCAKHGCLDCTCGSAGKAAGGA